MSGDLLTLLDCRLATIGSIHSSLKLDVISLLILLPFCWITSAGADGDAARPVAPDSAAAAAAIARAGAAIEAARALGNLWLETPQQLARAIEQNGRGNYSDAVNAAERAYEEARMAENQAKLERARYLFESEGTRLGAAERDTVRALLHTNDGAAALRAMQDALAQ